MWPFLKPKTKSKGKTKTQVLEWAKKQQSEGVPLMVIWDEIMNSTTFRDDVEVIRAHTLAGDEVFNVMLERNLKGQELESSGHLEEAVNLYEKNLADRFTGLHPYESLRVIYTKQKRYAAAIRVCKSYIDLPRTPNAQNSASKKVEKMQHHLSKLLEKQTTSY